MAIHAWDEQTATGDERMILEAFLNDFREAVTRKLQGVSEEGARRRLVPSATTLGGLVKHLRRVEWDWFERALERDPEMVAPPWADDEPEADFAVEPEETVAQLIAEYDEQCERSRAIAAHHTLDDVGIHPALGRRSLRWIYVHMIDETARHAGHLDILREQIDGARGDGVLAPAG